MSEEVKTEDREQPTGPTTRRSKRAAVAQWQSGVPARRVAEGLGITTESLRAWRRQFAGTQAESPTAAQGKLPAVGRYRRKCVGCARRFRVSPISATL